MSEREKWLQGYMSLISETLERIETMDEAQVLRTLQSIRCSEEHQEQTLAFLKSVSIPHTDSEDELTGLRKELNSPTRRRENAFNPMQPIEHALKQRLETLRRERRP